MTANSKAILLTGVTGVLGARLLMDLLTSTQANIYCLVRAENAQLAMQRIEKFLLVYDPGKLFSSSLKSRVIPLLGDITKVYLGLDFSLYRTLVEQIDLVIHAAANINLFISYESAKMVNLEGTKRVIKLCQAADAKLIYISSYSVLGSRLFEKNLTFKENELDVNQSFDDMPYARTKFETEQLLHQLGREGFRWLIFRTGNILGDSISGCYPLNITKVPAIFYEAFKSVIETGLAPFMNEQIFEITPVDYISKAIVNTALRTVACQQTFHLFNPHNKTFLEIINLLIEYGYRVRFVEINRYSDLFKNNQVFKNGKVYRSTFTNLLSAFSKEQLNVFQTANLDTTFTKKFFADLNITCPAPDIKLLTTYLDYCIKQDYFSSPQKQTVLAKIT